MKIRVPGSAMAEILKAGNKIAEGHICNATDANEKLKAMLAAADTDGEHFMQHFEEALALAEYAMVEIEHANALTRTSEVIAEELGIYRKQ